MSTPQGRCATPVGAAPTASAVGASPTPPAAQSSAPTAPATDSDAAEGDQELDTAETTPVRHAALDVPAVSAKVAAARCLVAATFLQRRPPLPGCGVSG